VATRPEPSQLKRNKEEYDGKLARLRGKLAASKKQIADSIKARDFAAAKAKANKVNPNPDALTPTASCVCDKGCAIKAVVSWRKSLERQWVPVRSRAVSNKARAEVPCVDETP